MFHAILLVLLVNLPSRSKIGGSNALSEFFTRDYGLLFSACASQAGIIKEQYPNVSYQLTFKGTTIDYIGKHYNAGYYLPSNNPTNWENEVIPFTPRELAIPNNSSGIVTLLIPIWLRTALS
jgi:hypothetical protein